MLKQSYRNPLLTEDMRWVEQIFFEIGNFTIALILTTIFLITRSIVEPWNNLLDARYPVRYKDCTQNVFVNFGHEDCLNLHIYVPKVESKKIYRKFNRKIICLINLCFLQRISW